MKRIVLAALLCLISVPCLAVGVFWATSATPVQNQLVCTVNTASFNFSGAIGSCTGQTVAVRVVVASGAVAVTTSDFVVVVNKTSGAATTVNLPASPLTGAVVWIKDGKGDANTNNITITPAAGNIDGSATDVINTAYGAALLEYNGTQWNVLAESSGLL